MTLPQLNAKVLSTSKASQAQGRDNLHWFRPGGRPTRRPKQWQRPGESKARETIQQTIAITPLQRHREPQASMRNYQKANQDAPCTKLRLEMRYQTGDPNGKLGIDTNIKAGITLGTRPRNQFDIELESKWMTNKRQQTASRSAIKIGDPMGKPTGDQQGKSWGTKGPDRISNCGTCWASF